MFSLQILLIKVNVGKSATNNISEEMEVNLKKNLTQTTHKTFNLEYNKH